MTSDHDASATSSGLGFRLSWPADWRALISTRANVLLTGPDRATIAFVKAVAPDLRTPTSAVPCDRLLPLDSAATMILHKIESLAMTEQQRLLVWLNDDPDRPTQLISIAGVPMYQMVEENRFLRPLFYRLNTIHIEVESD